jgi:hypothetical protein
MLAQETVAVSFPERFFASWALRSSLPPIPHSRLPTPQTEGFCNANHPMGGGEIRRGLILRSPHLPIPSSHYLRVDAYRHGASRCSCINHTGFRGDTESDTDV